MWGRLDAFFFYKTHHANNVWLLYFNDGFDRVLGRFVFHDTTPRLNFVQKLLHYFCSHKKVLTFVAETYWMLYCTSLQNIMVNLTLERWNLFDLPITDFYHLHLPSAFLSHLTDLMFAFHAFAS